MRFPILCLTALWLTATAGPAAAFDVVHYVDTSSYSTSDFGYAAAKGPVPVKVYGAPASGVEPAAAAAKIAEAFASAHLFQRAEFKAYDGETAGGYFIAVRFGGRGGAAAVCKGAAPSATERTYLTVFCTNDRPLSYISGRIGDGDINGRAFRRSFASLALELLPPTDASTRGDCPRFGCN